MVPTEIGLNTYRVTTFNEGSNDQAWGEDIDLRVEALRNIDRAKRSAARYFNRKVRARQFCVAELVLSQHKFSWQDRVNKLSPKWEGPHRVASIPYLGAYVLQDMDGRTLPHTFNAKALKRFYY